jgi:hypothetical protein
MKGTEMANSSGNGLEMVSGNGPIRVNLRGIEDNDVIKLLEDTAEFIRSRKSEIAGSARDHNDLEIMFKRVDMGDFVILSVRS